LRRTCAQALVEGVAVAALSDLGQRVAEADEAVTL